MGCLGWGSGRGPLRTGSSGSGSKAVDWGTACGGTGTEGKIVAIGAEGKDASDWSGFGASLLGPVGSISGSGVSAGAAGDGGVGGLGAVPGTDITGAGSSGGGCRLGSSIWGGLGLTNKSEFPGPDAPVVTCGRLSLPMGAANLSDPELTPPLAWTWQVKYDNRINRIWVQ